MSKKMNVEANQKDVEKKEDHMVVEKKEDETKTNADHTETLGIVEIKKGRSKTITANVSRVIKRSSDSKKRSNDKSTTDLEQKNKSSELLQNEKVVDTSSSSQTTKQKVASNKDKSVTVAQDQVINDTVLVKKVDSSTAKLDKNEQVSEIKTEQIVDKKTDKTSDHKKEQLSTIAKKEPSDKVESTTKDQIKSESNVKATENKLVADQEPIKDQQTQPVIGKVKGEKVKQENLVKKVSDKQTKQKALSKSKGQSDQKIENKKSASKQKYKDKQKEQFVSKPAKKGQTIFAKKEELSQNNSKMAVSSTEIESNVVQKPVGKIGKVGKIGNIFDQSAGSAKKSSLALTVERHAQKLANKSKKKDEKSSQGRSRNHSNQGGAGSKYQSRPARSQGGGFGGFSDKDKDDDKPKFQSRSRKPAKKTETVSDVFMTGKSSQSRRNDRFDKKNKDYDRDGNKGNRRSKGRIKEDAFFEQRSHKHSKHKNQSEAQVKRPVLTHVSLPQEITVKEFAEALKKTTAEIIKQLMKLGMMATINQVIDYDTAALIANELGIETDELIEVTEEDILFDESEDLEENLQTRPPVVVVMGHVDHGKTSLLDFYRNSSVVSGEAGGITQHIGAYMVTLNDRKITFLDTPGHEAFTTMRARGAMVTDIAILVVAADDGVMPQTVEAINHAKAANTEVIVAINKIDKEGANIDKVKQELSKHELIPEEWGGTTVMVPVSAKTGAGMEELLEMILLNADVLDLKANPNRQAKGTVIEAKLDKNRGPVATLLIQRGTLRASDTIVTGSIVGNIRAMTNASGKKITEAGPSVPVEIMGLPSVPEAGEIFYSVENEKMAKQLAEKRLVQSREEAMKKSSRVTLESLFNRLSQGEMKDLNIIVKADVQGSVEAVTQSLERLKNDEVNVRVIHGAVGAVTESDLRLAEVSNAILIGFNVRPATNVEAMAKESGIDLRLYRVIYNAIEDVEAAMRGMLDPEFEEVSLGSIEIRNTFKIPSIGIVGGGYVLSGKVNRNALVRVVRDGIVVAEDAVHTLRRFKDDVKEVQQGYECGITLDKFKDIKEGDIIEAFEMREIERK